MVCVLSHVLLFATLWTVAHQAPLSMGFPGKNTRMGCHFLLQGNLPNPGTEPKPPVSPALAGGFFTSEPPGKLLIVYGSFCALMAELNNHKRDPLAHKAQNIYHRALCRNSLSALKNSLGNCYTFSHIILFSGGSYFSSEIVDLLL